MKTPLITNQNLLALSHVWGWILLWGILLVVLGCVAISVSTLTTLISVIFLGVLILLGGIVMLVDSFKSWWNRWGGFLLHFLIAILYIIVGTMLIVNPLRASISITLLLGIFFLVIGVFRIAYSLFYLLPQWGLTLLNGLISLLLGILILESWPASSLFIIGLFIGIDLLISGFTYIVVAFSVREIGK